MDLGSFFNSFWFGIINIIILLATLHTSISWWSFRGTESILKTPGDFSVFWLILWQWISTAHSSNLQDTSQYSGWSYGNEGVLNTPQISRTHLSILADLMAMNKYCTLQNCSLTSWCSLLSYARHSLRWWGLTPLQRYRRCILKPQFIGINISV